MPSRRFKILDQHISTSLALVATWRFAACLCMFTSIHVCRCLYKSERNMNWNIIVWQLASCQYLGHRLTSCCIPPRTARRQPHRISESTRTNSIHTYFRTISNANACLLLRFDLPPKNCWRHDRCAHDVTDPFEPRHQRLWRSRVDLLSTILHGLSECDSLTKHTPSCFSFMCD